MKAEILSKRVIHDGWTKLFMARVRLPDGAEVDREIEDHGETVAVLPYDPDRRVAMLVKLPRAPVMDAGEIPFLEAPAGMIDADEADDAARREVLEEVGLRVRDLERVATTWTSAGISTERLHLYLGRFNVSDKLSAGGGAEGEHENITVVEQPLSSLWSAVQQHTVRDMKTLLLLHVLHTKAPQLFESGQ